eukprot:1148766-Pelagomonas_calceolata.AAC.16
MHQRCILASNATTSPGSSLPHLIVLGVDVLHGVGQGGLVLGLKHHVHHLHAHAVALVLGHHPAQLGVGAGEQTRACTGRESGGLSGRLACTTSPRYLRACIPLGGIVTCGPIAGTSAVQTRRWAWVGPGSGHGRPVYAGLQATDDVCVVPMAAEMMLHTSERLLLPEHTHLALSQLACRGMLAGRDLRVRGWRGCVIA